MSRTFNKIVKGISFIFKTKTTLVKFLSDFDFYFDNSFEYSSQLTERIDWRNSRFEESHALDPNTWNWFGVRSNATRRSVPTWSQVDRERKRKRKFQAMNWRSVTVSREGGCTKAALRLHSVAVAAALDVNILLGEPLFTCCSPSQATLRKAGPCPTPRSTSPTPPHRQASGGPLRRGRTRPLRWCPRWRRWRPRWPRRPARTGWTRSTRWARRWTAPGSRPAGTARRRPSGACWGCS